MLKEHWVSVIFLGLDKILCAFVANTLLEFILEVGVVERVELDAGEISNARDELLLVGFIYQGDRLLA